MVYAYDLWTLLPVKDLYDSQIMLAAVSAAKDMYDKAEEEMKEFRKEFGDFYSPFLSDMKWYRENFDPSKIVNDIYARGGDPLRSSTDRGELRKWLYSRPYADYNARKLLAKNVEEYLKNRGILESKNKFNPDYEQSVLGYRPDGTPITILNWDFAKDGPWTRTSPAEYQDLNEYAGHIFDNMEDGFIESDPKTGLDWFGVSRERRQQALTPHLSDLINTPLGRFHYNNSVAEAARKLGRTPTQQEAMQQFLDDVLTMTSEYEHRNYKENPSFARKEELNASIALDSARTANEIYKAKVLRANTPGYDSRGNAIPGYNGDNSTHNIFREAEAYANHAVRNMKYVAGSSVGYVPNVLYYLEIDPVKDGRYVRLKDAANFETDAFAFDSKTMNLKSSYYVLGEDGLMHGRHLNVNGDGEFKFIPGGFMRAQKTPDGYKYYISGEFITNTNVDGWSERTKDGNSTYTSGETWIQVKERYGKYGENKKKDLNSKTR